MFLNIIPRDDQGSSFIDLLWVLAPERNDLVALLQTYFDESHGPDGRMCVAGYAFTKSRAITFDRLWRRKVLGKYALPYFRMSSCAHGNDPFDKLNKDERLEAEKQAIAIIHETALRGVAATVDPDVWQYVTRNHPVARMTGTPYEFCTWICILMISIWAREERTGGAHSISYIFESGDANQSKANSMMNFAFKHKHVRDYTMYGGHAFFPKEKATPTQAADLLAWQWFTDRKRVKKKPYTPRKDLRALIDGGINHTTVHADEEFLVGMLYDMRRFYEGKPMLGISSLRRLA